MARIWGGCHDRSPARSPAVLLLSRLRYRDCDRDRDPDHLMECVLGARQLNAVVPFARYLIASGSADHTEIALSGLQNLRGVRSSPEEGEST
jgi:hypothetical protein